MLAAEFNTSATLRAELRQGVRIVKGEEQDGVPLALDRAAELELTFRDLETGFGYGVAWLP